MKLNIWYCLFTFCLLTISAYGQEKPLQNEAASPVELNVGNNRFGLQFLMNKHFKPASKFSFLSVTSFLSFFCLEKYFEMLFEFCNSEGRVTDLL